MNDNIPRESQAHHFRLGNRHNRRVGMFVGMTLQSIWRYEQKLVLHIFLIIGTRPIFKQNSPIHIFASGHVVHPRAYKCINGRISAVATKMGICSFYRLSQNGLPPRVAEGLGAQFWNKSGPQRPSASTACPLALQGHCPLVDDDTQACCILYSCITRKV